MSRSLIAVPFFKTKYIVLLILVIGLLCSCGGPMNPEGTWRSGTYKLKTEMTFYGFARSYLLHVPEKIPKGKWPLVIVLHGAFSKAHAIEEQSEFSRLADEEGFCVAYPNGIGIFGLLQHWNAGHCCGKAAKDGVDDVAFLDDVIKDAANRFPVDEERIFMVGHSNGGMMVYRYAAEGSQRIAGAAVVAGAINSEVKGQEETWHPSFAERPIPMLILHGTADQNVPLRGGVSPAKSDSRIYAALSEAEDFWRSCNGDAAVVRVERLAGWGHDWPGPYYTERPGVADSMHGYNAAEVIWEFFRLNTRHQ